MDETRAVIDGLYEEKNKEGHGHEPSLLSPAELGSPDSGIDAQVEAMYRQAGKHRTKLIHFYVTYTYWFTVAVLMLIFAQAVVRILTKFKDFEIMPQWSLDILISGMFIQFVGLLKIVTENVWNFKSFFSHHSHMLKNHK
jgi:hypothetical protein